MENPPKSFDSALRKKFEHFTPSPPEHSWDGIAAGIAANSKSIATVLLWKRIGYAASILLLAGLAYWWFLPNTSENQTPQTTQENITAGDSKTSAGTSTEEIDEPEAFATDKDDMAAPTADTESNVPSVQTNDIDATASTVTGKGEQTSGESIAGPLPGRKDYTSGNLTPKTGYPIPTKSSAFTLSPAIQPEIPAAGKTIPPMPPPVSIGMEAEEKQARWSHGFYFTPEFMLTELESVTVLPSYTIGYEPTFYINDHLFMRFGAGLQYARDRGFAKIDFERYEVVGTYEDVYDVTFDEIDGVLVPTYYTNTVEIWDSVRRLDVAEVTNSYLYLQVPVLFGYQHTGSRFNWFFYGGPAVNLMLIKNIDKPEERLANATIFDLENELPERSSYHFQVWLGAGLAYKLNGKIALTVEPNYRYNFGQLYEDDQYNKSMSGIALRFGIIYKVR